MVEGAAQSRRAMTAPVSRLRSRTASLSAVEPNGLFVDCGPALFDRPDPLPHASCADAYFPLPAVSALLIAAGVLGVVIGVGLLVRLAISGGRPS